MEGAPQVPRFAGGPDAGAGKPQSHELAKSAVGSEAMLLPKKRKAVSPGQIAILVLVVFLKGGLLGAYVPFSALWLSKKGFTARDLGCVAIVDAMSSCLLPLIGSVVDRLRAHNSCFAIILASLAVLKLAYLPAAGSFASILMLTAVTAPLMKAASSLLDSLTLYAFPERGHYSRVRLAGDLGFGVIAFLTGIAIDASGSEDAIFWKFAELCALLAVIWVMVTPFMTNIRPDSRCMTNGEFSVQFRLFASNFRNLGMARALFLLYLLGSTLGLIGMFEFVLMEEMGSSGLLLGSCKIIGAITAIPCWWYSAAVMDKVGFKNMQLIALGACATRLFILSAISRPVHALLSEAISGLGGFAFAYSSITVFMGRFVDEDMKATAQAIVFVVYVGLGAGSAPILGSLVVEWYGIQGMYFYAASLLTVAFFCIGTIDLTKACLLGSYVRLEDDCKPRKLSDLSPAERNETV